MTGQVTIATLCLIGLAMHASAAGTLPELPADDEPPMTTTQGCQAWPVNPQFGATASWSGPCVDGRANGTGTLILTWRLGEERYVGAMRAGRANGQGSFVYST